MIRVVVDTNIFISSFFGGNPRKIIDLWKSGQIILCLSRPIIDEYINVLRRMGLQNERELEELLSVFAHGFHVFGGLKVAYTIPWFLLYFLLIVKGPCVRFRF